MEILKNIILVINHFFLCYIIIYVILILVLAFIGSIVLYFEEQKKKHKNQIERDYYLPVSIIVNMNQEDMISKIDSLLHLNYKLYEIIIVADGIESEDIIKHYHLKKIEKVVQTRIETKKIHQYYEGFQKIKITLIEKEKGGKADALNAGINAATYPYFLALDNKILEADALTELVRPIMEDLTVIAASGTIKIKGSKKNNHFFEIAQVLENGKNYLIDQTVFDLWNANIKISEGFTLFKKQSVIEVGGYQINTVEPDTELLLRLHEYALSNRNSYQIKYEPLALCYEKTKGTLKTVKEMTVKKNLGIFQSLFGHRNMFLKSKYKIIGSVSFLKYIISKWITPLVEIIGLISIILSYCLQIINTQTVLYLFGIYLLYSVIMETTIFFNRIYIDYKIGMRKMSQIIVYSFIWAMFRPIMNWYRFTSLFKYKKYKF